MKTLALAIALTTLKSCTATGLWTSKLNSFPKTKTNHKLTAALTVHDWWAMGATMKDNCTNDQMTIIKPSFSKSLLNKTNCKTKMNGIKEPLELSGQEELVQNALNWQQSAFKNHSPTNHLSKQPDKKNIKNYSKRIDGISIIGYFLSSKSHSSPIARLPIHKTIAQANCLTKQHKARPNKRLVTRKH